MGALPASIEDFTACIETPKLDDFSGKIGGHFWVAKLSHYPFKRFPEFCHVLGECRLQCIHKDHQHLFHSEVSLLGDLSWDFFCSALEGQYQSCNHVVNRSSTYLFVQNNNSFLDKLQKKSQCTLWCASSRVNRGTCTHRRHYWWSPPAVLLPGEPGACTTEECCRQVHLVESHISMGFRRQLEGSLVKGARSPGNGSQ